VSSACPWCTFVAQLRLFQEVDARVANRLLPEPGQNKGAGCIPGREPFWRRVCGWRVGGAGCREVEGKHRTRRSGCRTYSWRSTREHFTGGTNGLGRLAEFLGQMEGCLAGGESPRYGYLTPSSTGPRPGGCWLSQSDPGVWLGCPGCGCAGLAERWGPVVSRCVLGWCQLSKAFHLGCPQLCPFFAGILCPRMLPHP